MRTRRTPAPVKSTSAAPDKVPDVKYLAACKRTAAAIGGNAKSGIIMSHRKTP
jgi:hypothetical protein